MTSQLLRYAAYRPHYRLRRSAVSAALGARPAGSGCRTVAGYDEDVVTMAVAATRALGDARTAADRLYFATANAPLQDKSSSLIVHAATGMHDRVLALDLAGLRSGFGALVAASETGGVAAMADMRTGRPGSMEERDGGDGAAAFLFGTARDAVAEVLAICSSPIEIMDTWRVPGSNFAATGEDRFVAQALGEAVRDALSHLAKVTGITDPPSSCVVSAFNRRLAIELAASIQQSRVAPSSLALHRDRTGYCGAADVGLVLADALDHARAGDTVLVVSAAGGADVMLLRKLTDGPGVASTPDHADREIEYHKYLTWRGHLDREPARRPPRASVAPAAAFRDSAWKFGLVGSQCLECDKVYLPPERTCRCGAVDRFKPFPVADRVGTVVSHTTDAVSDSPNPPAVAALVDFGTTGRLLLELTDAHPDEVATGDQVVMTFRRSYVLDDVPNYFWKARPTTRRTS